MAVLPHEGAHTIMYGSFDVPVGASSRSGYLARPDEVGRFPVVIIIPDIDGMGSHEKELCRHLARSGIAALSIELYPSGSGVDYASRRDRRAMVDLEEVVEFLKSDDVDWAQADRVGVAGLEVGGRFALIAAATRRWAVSCVVISTPLTGDDDREHQVADYLDSIGIPVLGLYGAADELIANETVDEAQRRNDSGQWLLYKDAAHDFFDTRSDDYDPSAAGDANTRIAEWFRATLPAAETVDLG